MDIIQEIFDISVSNINYHNLSSSSVVCKLEQATSLLLVVGSEYTDC